MLEHLEIHGQRRVVFLPRTEEGPGRCPIENTVCIWEARPVPHDAKVRSRIGEDYSIIAWCNNSFVAVCGRRISAVEMALNRKRVQVNTSTFQCSLIRKPSPVEDVIPDVRLNLTGKVLPSLPPWPMARGIVPEFLVGTDERRNTSVVASGIGGVHEVLPALLDVGQSSPYVLLSRCETRGLDIYLR